MNLRKLARDRPCLVRLPGCDGGGETTVLAHYRLAGISGIGIKSPDLLGAWCCYNCHQLVDRHAHMANLTQQDVKIAHLEGVLRTIAALVREGAIET